MSSSIIPKFVIRGYRPDKEGDLFEATKAFVFEEQGFDPRDFCVDILGSGDDLRIQAYALYPVIVGRVTEWFPAAKARFSELANEINGEPADVRVTYQDG